MKGRNNYVFIGFVFFLIFFTVTQNTHAQIGGHRGAITAMLLDEKGRILSAGTDGFLQIWNQTNSAAELRFQISRNSISSMALRPGKTELAFIEASETGLSKISVWDYEQKRMLFTLPFSETVNNIFYSAGGSFLLVTGSMGVTLVHSESGSILPSPGELTGPVVLAATGASERSMVTYLSSGYLRYWNLEMGNMTQSFNVPRDIKSPILLGNNRFLAGFDTTGLIVLDAVSGTIIFREPGITNGTLFTGNPEGREFICMSASTLYHLTISSQNRIETLNRRNTANLPAVSAGLVISADSAALGTMDGRLVLFKQDGSSRFMDTQNQIRIDDIAASANVLAYRTENSLLGFIPLDYTRLNSNSVLRLEDAGPYTAISSSPGNSEFLLWQSDNIRSFPLIKRISNAPEIGSVSETFVDKLTLRFPLRSVSVYRNLYLFLDTVGNIRVINQSTGELLYDNLFSGTQDAVFINEQNIILGRSLSTGSSAFLMINIITGETVSIPLSATLGSKVYRGESIHIYGTAINRSGDNFHASLVYINTANPAASYSMADLDTDETNLSIAESAPFLAVTHGSGASIYRIPGINSSTNISGSTGTAMERSAGFPQKIVSNNNHFICLDTDGNISWHDPGTGRTLALFRIYADTWVLETGGRTIQGRIIYGNL